MSALTTLLTTRIENDLIAYEPQRQAVEDAAADFLNLNKKPYQTLNTALARTDTVHDIMVNELAANNLYPWVSPRLAAIAFEGLFEASVAVWLAAGPPQNPAQLRPGVARFVSLQVRAFAAAIGDRLP
jgi:hypothetical protein